MKDEKSPPPISEVCIEGAAEAAWQNFLRMPAPPNLDAQLMPDVKAVWKAWNESPTKHLHLAGPAEMNDLLAQHMAKTLRYLLQYPNQMAQMFTRYILLGMSLQKSGKLRMYFPDAMPHPTQCLCEECAPDIYNDLDMELPN